MTKVELSPTKTQLALEEHSVNKNVNDVRSQNRITISAYETPIDTPLLNNFFKFMKSYKPPIILKSIENFSAWYMQTEFILKCLGLSDIVTKLLEARSRDCLIICQRDEEAVIKQVVSATVDQQKFIICCDTTAQEELYNIVHILGLVKSCSGVMKMQDDFTIDVRNPLAVNLRKWEIMNFTSKFSNIPINTRCLVLSISKNFPRNVTFRPLIEFTLSVVNGNGRVDVAQVIGQIHRMAGELCDVHSSESKFMCSDSNTNFHIGNSDKKPKRVPKGVHKNWQQKQKSKYRVRNRDD